MRNLPLATTGVALALTLSACAGSAGGQTTDGGTSIGFAFGATQEEVDEALADLEPITLTYQSAAASPDSVQAKDIVWAEAIEERSGGKITVDTLYGQPVAGFDEIHDALADGRVDLAYTLPGYDPSRFPRFDDLSYALSVLPSSPVTGELVANAVGLELSWASEPVLEEFESQGLVPLQPVNASASPYPACTEPGAKASNWDGRQIRAASRSQEAMAMAIGATPVSLEYTEVFEGLQRNTIDCALNSLNSAYDYGFLEAAPHVSYSTDTSVPRAPGAVLGGSGVANLPLPYRQVVFDSLTESFIASAEVVIDGNYEGVAQIHALGGSLEEMDSETQQAIADVHDELIEEIEAEGALGTDLRERILASGEKWTSKAEELGFTEEGDFSSLDEWYDEETEFRPFAEAVYADVLLSHRPE